MRKDRGFINISRANTPALTPLSQAARDAWIYTLPLIETAGARDSASKAARPNTLATRRELNSHLIRRVTTPNNDTLYTSAWIDLSNGPARLTIPSSGSRYMSVAFMGHVYEQFCRARQTYDGL